MNLRIVEEEKNKLKIEFVNETDTITHLLARAAREEGADAAAVRDHPFLEEPKIVVMADKPRSVLKNAAQKVLEWCDEFKDEFNKNIK